MFQDSNLASDLSLPRNLNWSKSSFQKEDSHGFPRFWGTSCVSPRSALAQGSSSWSLAPLAAARAPWGAWFHVSSTPAKAGWMVGFLEGIRITINNNGKRFGAIRSFPPCIYRKLLIIWITNSYDMLWSIYLLYLFIWSFIDGITLLRGLTHHPLLITYDPRDDRPSSNRSFRS